MDASLDAILDLAARLRIGAIGEGGEGLVEAIQSTKSACNRAIDNVRAKKDILTKELEDAEANAKALNEKITAIGNTIEEQRGRLDTAVSTFQSQFSTSEDGRRQEHDKRIKELDSQTAAKIGETDKRLSIFTAKSERFTKEVLDELNSMKTKAAELLGIIGNIGVSGDYQNNAKSEKTAANVFRWIALALMVLIVGGVAFTLYGVIIGKGWQNVLMRIGITLAIAIPAAYTARESEKHRQLERRYKRLELELSTIDAYLQPLPKDNKDEIKGKLAEHYFGKKGEAAAKMRIKDKSQFANSIVGLISKAIDEYTSK